MVFKVVIIKQNERNTDMYTPLAFLTGKIFPVYGTTHFYITTTTHPHFLIVSRATVFNFNPINIGTF